MQPSSIPPVPLKGKVGRDITSSGYQRNSTGKWTWGGKESAPPISRSKSMASLEHAAPSVSSPAKDLKVLHATTAKNIVGSEFRNAGQVGLEVWRMENMTAKPIPKDQHGKFYSGDAYIVLNVTSEKSSSYHIHFWIGKESSQDKYGTAAYKTVELDNKFTGSAIHHREEQEKESELFKSYFKNGIEYLAGGTKSSFKHVLREQFPKRLLHLKGRRSVQVKQVEATYKSLNMGDVFILDVGRTIFQWNGSQASRTERVKGVEVIRNIKDNERGGRATIIVVEYSTDEKLNQNKKVEQFWEALGEKGPIGDADAAGDDDEFEKQVLASIVLHKITVERDQIKTEIITERPLKKEMLDPHNAYVLDAATEVFVWLGKTNSANQKNFASDFAKKIHSERASWAPFVKIVQGAETPLFKEKFFNWKQLFPKNLDYGASSQMLPSYAKRTEYPKDEIDLEKIISTKPKPRPENALLHAGTGVLKIWKIEDFKKVELPESQHGIFFSSTCYICLYVEVKDQRRSHYIYFWQGRHSTKEHKGASALLAKEMADTIRGKQQQFRVVHNKEPEHFVMLFKGKMIIGMGEHPKTREDLGGLYHIKHHPGNWEWHVKAAQVPMTSESLNSNDVFVLVATDRKCFVWVGIGSSSWERKVAKLVAARLVGDANVGKITTVDEGKEVSFFWPYFPGGKKEYASAEYLKWNSKAPRLFQCSNTNGPFKVEEIFNFTQEDLDMDDPFILDCYAEVYVWVGNGSNEVEKKLAMQTAMEYVAKASAVDERDPSTPIYYVTPGEEPLQFKCHFLAWDNDLIADTRGKEDEDDGTPLKSSIVFKPAGFNPEPQKPNFPPLKAKPAPDPNRPKLSFSYPSSTQLTATTTAPAEPKPTSDSRPALSFSYPKSSGSDSGAAVTTPRGTVIHTKPATTPRATSTTTSTPRATSPIPATSSRTSTASVPAVVENTQVTSVTSEPAESKSVTHTDDTTASAPSATAVNDQVSSDHTASASVASDLVAGVTVDGDPVGPVTSEQISSDSIKLVHTNAPADVVQEENAPSETVPVASASIITTASDSSSESTHSENAIPATPPPEKAKSSQAASPSDSTSPAPVSPTPPRPAFSLNLGSAKASAAESATQAHDDALGTPTSGTVTPGRHSRPPWVKTKAENAKLVATLIPPSPKPTTVATPAVVSVVSPRVASPAPTTILITPKSAPVPVAAAISTALLFGAPASTSAALASVAAAASITAAISVASSPVISTSVSTTQETESQTQETPAHTQAQDPQTPKPKTQEFQKINLEKGKPKPLGLVQVELAKYNREFYTLEELTARKKPPGVDVTSLEKYLLDEEFMKVFGMTKEKFYQIPVWKRVTLRKDKKLY